MGTPQKLWRGFAAAALAATAAFAGDGQLPNGAIEALAWSTPLIEGARKAPSAESSEQAKCIRRAIDWMQPFVKAGSAGEGWAGSWNEALTLTKFHRNKPTGEYALDAQRAIGGYLEFGIPKGRGWSFAPQTPGANDVWSGTISRKMPDGRLAATVAIGEFHFNATYGGVGGENATGLAKRQLEQMKDLFEKVDSSSKQVSAKPLSKSITRSQYIEAEGSTAKDGRLRVRNYYVKSSTRTFVICAYQYLGTLPADTPCEAWQKGVEDPELAAVLASFAEGDPAKRRK